MKASIESNLSGKKIAIVGGSGFVGSNIAGSLSEDFNVMVLDVSPPPFDVAQHVSFR
jgi:nucleoside-diphosphate-sugar epimerase